MPNIRNDILTFPYWPTDRTQNALYIPGGILGRELQDIAINTEPLRETNHNNIPVVMRPRLGQDLSQMANLSDHPTYGVTAPGGLFADLLASTSAPTTEKGAAHGP